MVKPRKESLNDQILNLLKSVITQPLTDQSSAPPTPADVRRVKAAVGGSRKATKKKARDKKSSRKRGATTKKTRARSAKKRGA